MSIHRTLAIVRKEFRHIWRDPRTFFLVAVSPAFLLLLLSHIFAFDVEQVDLALLDMDRTPLSRQYAAALTADGDLRIRAWVGSLEEIDQLLAAGDVDAGLVIPPGFEADVRAGRAAQVQVALDGADPIAAGQTAADLEQRTAAFAARRWSAAPRDGGGLDLRIVARYNPTLKTLISMVPGLGAIVLSMPALGLALALAREKETGSFEGLIATPVRGAEYLVGKTVAYLISGLMGVVLAWMVAVLYFRVPFRGDVLAYLILAADFLLAAMGVSLFIANFTRSQQTTMLLVLTVFFAPSFFIAGLISPVDIRDLASRLIAYGLPTTHFITISRAMFLKGLGIGDLGFPALMLLGMGAGGLLISLLLFRKKLG